jgi:hypothetical protein
MAFGDATLTVDRLDGERLTTDGLSLARAFFISDPSSLGPSSYDALAGHGDVDQIRTLDVETLNRTMRARSKHAWWAPITDQVLVWLEAIPHDLDLIEADGDLWEARRGAHLARQALAAAIGPHRGAAVATKMLHLKRPKFFPVLDDLVAQMLGVNAPGNPTREQRVETAHRLLLHLREEGRRNLRALQLIQRNLRAEGIDRSLVRILDAILWFSHPAAGIPNAPRILIVQLSQTAEQPGAE